ncbi:MAG TPA: trigger factor [Dehalococcoidia bacterium]|nr:trigger factor [Dehalococcoidia bacterium]HLE01864.1 trigger factor [Dehalococcoidia bacterium]
MRIASETLPDRQVSLEIEVDPERVERSLEGAYRRLGRRTRIPGFRPGMAPRTVVERFLGRDALLREALDDLLPQVVQEALDEQGLEAIDLPSLEVKSLEPVVVKATVPLKPRVELGDYGQVRVPREEVGVPEERVEAVLDDLRHRYATWEPVDRPVEKGDLVRADVAATVEEKTILEEEDAEFQITEGEVLEIPDVLMELVGAKEGEVREFSRLLPESHPRPSLAGRPCLFRFAIKAVKEEQLPALDDGFAREVGEGFPTLAALRERTVQDLKAQAQEEAEAAYREQAMEALLSQATVEFPPVLLEREVDRLLRERVGYEDLEGYLRRLGRSEEDLREELKPLALQRVSRSLVVNKLAEVEGIQVAPQETAEEIERMVETSSRSEELQRLLTSDAGRGAIARALLGRRVMVRMAAIAAGEMEAASPASSESPSASSPTPREESENSQ